MSLSACPHHDHRDAEHKHHTLYGDHSRRQRESRIGHTHLQGTVRKKASVQQSEGFGKLKGIKSKGHEHPQKQERSSRMSQEFPAPQSKNNNREQSSDRYGDDHAERIKSKYFSVKYHCGKERYDHEYERDREHSATSEQPHTMPLCVLCEESALFLRAVPKITGKKKSGNIDKLYVSASNKISARRGSNSG